MIITRLSGGMGNQMFQYAAGRALSIKNNVPLGLDVAFLLDRTPRKNFTFRNFDLDVFDIQAQLVPQSRIPFLFRKHSILFDKFRRKLWRRVGTEKYFQFDAEVLNAGPNMYIEGYWQSPKYFSEVQEQIRKDFILKKALSEHSSILKQQIANSNSIGIHVRRKDYIGNTMHDISIEQKYYAKGVQHITEHHTITTIYVFSDDIEWCKQHLHFDIETVFVGPEYAGQKGEEHLVLLSTCKHFVIANSSYSWWAVWLATNAEKIVIAPKKWFNNSFDTSDLIPPEWIRL